LPSAAATGMSDDDWDNSDIDADAILAEAEKAKKKAEREDDSDSEDERKAKEEAERKAALESLSAKPKKAGKAKAKSGKKGAAVDEIDYDALWEKRLDDPAAERLRLRRLEEEADARATADLFGGLGDDVGKKSRDDGGKKPRAQVEEKKVQIVVQDAFDKLVLKQQADVDSLSGICLDKLNKSKCKGAGQKFFTDLFKALSEDLELRDLESLEKSLADIAKLKKVEKTASASEKVKGNKMADKHTKFNVQDEVGVVYGGGAEWDDWDEDWDDWAEAK